MTNQLDGNACIDLFIGIIRQAQRDVVGPRMCTQLQGEQLQREASEFLALLQQQAEDIDLTNSPQIPQGRRRRGRVGGTRWEFQESEENRRHWRQRH